MMREPEDEDPAERAAREVLSDSYTRHDVAIVAAIIRREIDRAVAEERERVVARLRGLCGEQLGAVRLDVTAVRDLVREIEKP